MERRSSMSTVSSTSTARVVVHEWKVHRPHIGQQRLRSLLAKPDAKVVVAVLGRRWGKTTGTVEALLDIAIRCPGIRIGWFAHVSKSMKVAWEHACSVTPPSALAKKSETDKTLTFLQDARIAFGSLDEPDNILGWGYDIIVLDEGARISKYARDEIIAPMAADRNGVVVVITTPKGKLGKASWVWRDYKKAQQHAPGYYCMTGPSMENPLKSIQEWAAWAKDNLPDKTFKQEILAQFMEGGGGIINLRPICTVEGTEDRPVKLPYRAKPMTQERHVIGIDLAETQNFTVVTALGLTSRRVKWMDRFQRIGWDAQIARMKKAVAACPGQVVIDGTGIGKVVSQMMRKAGVPHRRVVYNNEIKTNLVQGLQVAVEQEEFAMPWIEEAVSEAETFEEDVLSSGRMKYGAASGFHDDIINSLALAVQAAQRRITGVPR